MPSISKVRFTNVVYDNGNKRYIDTTFRFDGQNGILLLENGAGKTVFVQTLIQAVLPHEQVANRRIQDTLQLSNNIAHIAVEWILEEQPQRRYAVTAVSLFMNSNNKLASQRFAMEYAGGDFALGKIPFVREEAGRKRAASKEEMAIWCRGQADHNMLAKYFSENDTLQSYYRYLEDHYKIIASEWHKIASINSDEGGVEAYFANCHNTNELLSRLLIPTVEEAISQGMDTDNGNGFVEMFQSQREHFRQQSRLQKRIGEMQQVLEELQEYNEVQKLQYQDEVRLGEIASGLKAGYTQLRNNLHQQALANEERESEKNQLQEDFDQTERDIQACILEESRRLWQNQEMKCRDAKDVLISQEQQFTKQQTELDNLKLAKLLVERTTAGQRKAEYEKSWQKLQEDVSLQELEKEYQNILMALRGWFYLREKQLQDKLLECQQQKQAEDGKLQDLVGQQSGQNQRIADRVADIGRLEGKISQLLESQEKIEETIFPDGIHQDANSLQRQWQHRLGQLEKNLVEYQKNIEFYIQQRLVVQEQMAQDKSALEASSAEYKEVAGQLQNIDNEADRVLKKLSYIPECSNTASNTKELYSRYEYFNNQIGDKLEQRLHSWQEQKRISRLAHRFWDMYEGHSRFMADPGLEDLVEKLSGDFDYLETGSQLYCQQEENNPEKARELLSRYPYWAATLVTSDKEKKKLAGKLAQYAKDLQQVVFVVSEQEYRGILEGIVPQGMECIVPGYWQKLGRKDFAKWLEELQENAREADVNEAALNEEIHQLRQTAQELQDFARTNQLSFYKELCQSQQKLCEALEKLKDSIDKGTKNVETCQSNIQKYQENISRDTIDKNDIQHRLQRLEEYIDLRKQHLKAIADKEKVLAALHELKQEANRLEEELASCRHQCNELDKKAQAYTLEISNLREKPGYGESANVPALEDGRDYDVLVEAMEVQKRRLDKCSESRQVLENKLANEEKEIARLEQAISELRDNAETVLKEAPEYPLDGKEREKQLLQEIRKGKQLLKKLRQENQEQRSEADKLQGAYEHGRKQYDAKYAEYPLLGENLPEIKEQLQNRKKHLQRKQKANRDAMVAGAREYQQLVELKQELEIKNETLKFAGENVATAVMDAAWQSYHAQQFRELLIPQLEQATDIWQQLVKKIKASEAAKDKFIQFCDGCITEVKVRSQVVEGIRKKQGYMDFVTWYNSMSETIEKIIALDEEAKQQHYEHIEQIVGKMTTYLQEVCHGLVELVNKTRVIIGEEHKNIFTIHIAPWEENQGRSAIRSCLNRLTEKLSSSEFLLDNGQENQEKISKYLASYLTTRKMLDCVMEYKNNTIRVRCHKAISSGRFSERTFTWEESNRWSGGEMWSKNMALFLGCLCYLSEKRCHIKRSKSNNRVVIADNPFGKASSEHVLEPVFYIAKELGFQLIALTAHEDGSFIRRYFPVVYSCRLGNLANQKGKVLQPQLELKTAYMEEVGGDTLNRLLEADYEQGSLF